MLLKQSKVKAICQHFEKYTLASYFELERETDTPLSFKGLNQGAKAVMPE